MRRPAILLLLVMTAALHAEVKLDGTFDWESGKVKKLCKGIVYTSFELKSPRLMKLSAARIDFSAAKFQFKMIQRDPDWGKPMPDFPQGIIRTRRITCRNFMKNAVKKGENMVLAVNGSPWSPFHAPWTHKYAGNQGLIVADGVLVAPVRAKRPSFVVYKDGNMEFKIFTEKDDLSNIAHAISGFGFVLRDGELTPKNNPKAKLAPRTGYGLSKDKRYMYIIAIDGRQEKYSMGANTYEVGQWLKYLGAYSGLNMDGGGSTTLILRKDKNLLKLNYHAYKHERATGINYERAVGGCMGIILKD